MIKTGKKQGIKDTLENMGVKELISLGDCIELYNGVINVFDILEGYSAENEEYYYIAVGDAIKKDGEKPELIATFIPGLMRDEVYGYYNDPSDMDEIRARKYDLIIEEKERKNPKPRMGKTYFTGYFEVHNT